MIPDSTPLSPDTLSPWLALHALLEQADRAWTPRDFYLAGRAIAACLNDKSPDEADSLSEPARARLFYLLGFAQVTVHNDWYKLMRPFNGVTTGPGSVAFWASENGSELRRLPSSGNPVDELASLSGLSVGAIISPLRRALRGEIL